MCVYIYVLNIYRFYIRTVVLCTLHRYKNVYIREIQTGLGNSKNLGCLRHSAAICVCTGTVQSILELHRTGI